MCKDTYNCIYYGKTRTHLTYNKREHIIPASLGGQKRLLNGIVSDQANELFSKYELKAVRHTFLSLNRMNNGPGKRGSFSVKKIKSSQIRLFEVVDSKQDEDLTAKYAPLRLGFIFCGNAYVIPQIIFPISKNGDYKMPIFLMDSISKNALSTTLSFDIKLSVFLSDKNKKFYRVSSNLNQDTNYMLLGVHNDTWFIASSLNENNLNNFLKAFEEGKITLPNKIPAFPNTNSLLHYNDTISTNQLLDDSFLWLYLKTAFNTLAFSKGNAFVSQRQFDSVRNAIISMFDTHKYIIKKQMPAWLITWVNTEVNPKEHFVVISAEKNVIEAYVSFYRERLTHSICLSNTYAGRCFKCFFVCDWQNKSERVFDDSV